MINHSNLQHLKANLGIGELKCVEGNFSIYSVPLPLEQRKHLRNNFQNKPDFWGGKEKIQTNERPKLNEKKRGTHVTKPKLSSRRHNDMDD